MKEQAIQWRGPGFTRVPYEVYSDAPTAQQEQECIFRGATWNYLCLEAELPEAGSYRTTFVGETPVVVVKDADGEIYAFENRCAHRGALIALEKSGRADSFQCVYHAWSYNLQGDLTGVAFEKGVKGQGGMPASFCKEEHGPRKLRIGVYCGLVFGSFSDDVLSIEEYLGDEICQRIERVLHKPVEVIGRFTQALPNNWKLYVENVKDSYHASLLHLFFTTFELNRLSQKGGVIVDESGGNHVSYSMIDKAAADASYQEQGLRSDNDKYRLKDTTVLEGFPEFDDGITLQILSVFPGFVLQQIQNCLAVRQVLPKGEGRSELNWTYLGYVGDTPVQRTVRLKQLNLVGPAGFISMEDGAVGGFVQRGIAGAQDLEAVIEMGGEDTGSADGRAVENSVRGFWKAYRMHMGA
ncbi:MAG: aromatic ring-hydroxylating dioxygenase subunit alpha [Rhodocyclaceae bacterium]|jgi:anthranilate 1,2-dioxygenase large subunit/terephthalate 1,2-dioxygenase oxygenase component alpha subunit|nr:aromatic ring-hydroxylating dioxygenase subunit alpha [Rhodocyclaceae bacterium]